MFGVEYQQFPAPGKRVELVANLFERPLLIEVVTNGSMDITLNGKDLWNYQFLYGLREGEKEKHYFYTEQLLPWQAFGEDTIVVELFQEESTVLENNRVTVKAEFGQLLELNFYDAITHYHHLNKLASQERHTDDV